MPTLHIVRVRESLDQPGHPARAAVGRQQRRDDDDAVDRVGSKQLVDGVVRGVPRLRRLERAAIDQQQMMARLAALRMEGIAELRLIPAAERIQVIQQRRDAKPMRRIPAPDFCVQGRERRHHARAFQGSSADQRRTARAPTIPPLGCGRAWCRAMAWRGTRDAGLTVDRMRSESFLMSSAFRRAAGRDPGAP